MKDSYTIEEVTKMLGLKAFETIRKYVRDGKNYTFEQITNITEPTGEPGDPYYALELVVPNKRPYLITRRSLELFLQRRALLTPEQILNLLNNFETINANMLEENTKEPKKEEKTRKKIHHLFGIKCLKYSYNGLSRTVDKISGNVKSAVNTFNDKSSEIIEAGKAISTKISSVKDSKEYFQEILTITRNIQKSVDEHNEELRKLESRISELEEELQKCVGLQEMLEESKDELEAKRKEIDSL